MVLSFFARRSASTARRFSSRAWWIACCSVKAAVICEAYRGFANMSLAVDVLAVAVNDGGGEGDGDEGEIACCFPLSDAEVPVD